MIETVRDSHQHDRILWVGKSKETVARLHKLTQFDFVFVSPDDESQIREVLTRYEVAVLVQEISRDVKPNQNWLGWARAQSLKASRLAVFDSASPAELADLVNTCSPHHWMGLQQPESKWIRALEKGCSYFHRAQREEKLMREASTKNRELDLMHRNLEDLVVERTHNLELRKNEIDGQQKRIRDLIRFVYDLGQIETVYDLMEFLRKEFRRISRAEPPILICQTPQKALRVLHFRSNQLLETMVRQAPAPQPASTERLFAREDQTYLANELGRPVMPVVAFSLPMSSEWSVLPSTLFLESRSTSLDEDLLQAVRERLQPLGIALDRILLGEQVRAASLQWEKTFDAIDTPVCIVDLDFRLLRANSRFTKTVQAPKCFQNFAKRETMCSGCPVADVLAGGMARTGLVRVQDRTFEVHSYPIRWREDLETTTVVNHYVDVTEGKELYGRMIQGEKMAALGLLAANIAHELNNPLTGIRSLSQVLQKTIENDPRLVEDLSEVESAAARCQKIISNLLDFTHSKSVGDQVFDLNVAVANTIPMLKTAMRYHNSGVNLEEAPLWVKGDPHLIQQVIFNLVNNACQAMKEPGSVLIETGVKNHRAHLKVTDTGPGIPSDVMDLIFDPFFTTKPVGEGTGLGLSVSRSIVEKFGGELSVRNLEEGGCEFVVALPSVEAPKSGE